MITTEAETLSRAMDAAANRACRALLDLEGYRRSPDPTMRSAYRAVHDLVGDLSGLRILVETLDERSGRRLGPGPRV